MRRFFYLVALSGAISLAAGFGLAFGAATGSFYGLGAVGLTLHTRDGSEGLKTTYSPEDPLDYPAMNPIDELEGLEDAP